MRTVPALDALAVWPASLEINHVTIHQEREKQIVGGKNKLVAPPSFLQEAARDEALPAPFGRSDMEQVLPISDLTHSKMSQGRATETAGGKILRAVRPKWRPFENPSKDVGVCLCLGSNDGCVFQIGLLHDSSNPTAFRASGCSGASQVSGFKPATGIDEIDPVHHFHQVDYRASSIASEANEAVRSNSNGEGRSRVVVTRQPAPTAAAPRKVEA